MSAAREKCSHNDPVITSPPPGVKRCAERIEPGSIFCPEHRLEALLRVGDHIEHKLDMLAQGASTEHVEALRQEVARFFELRQVDGSHA